MKITNYGLVAALALGTLVAVSSQAQEKKAEQKKHFTSERMPGNRMAEELKLTKEQQTKMRTFREEQRKKAEAIRNDTTLTQEQRKEKNAELRKDAQAKMKETLTAEQYAKWEKAHEQGKKGPASTPGERGKKKGHKKD